VRLLASRTQNINSGIRGSHGDVSPCSLVDMKKRFGLNCYHHLHGRSKSSDPHGEDYDDYFLSGYEDV
jgi:hypothetical protein